MNIKQFPGHMGRKIAKVRVLKDMKQATLASKMNTSHQAISRLEQSEFIDDKKLEAVAEALGVTVEELKNFSDEVSAFQIQDMHDNSQAIYQYNINPIEKIVELFEKLVTSEREKVDMMESLLQSEREKVEMLKAMMDKIK